MLTLIGSNAMANVDRPNVRVRAPNPSYANSFIPLLRGTFNQPVGLSFDDFLVLCFGGNVLLGF